jgi:ABC-type antimicrobial peptide transport system permease subunit
MNRFAHWWVHLSFSQGALVIILALLATLIICGWLAARRAKRKYP